MTPASLSELLQAVSPVIETEWMGASNPLSSAAKDHQSLLVVVEKACGWVLDHIALPITLRFRAVHRSVGQLGSIISLPFIDIRSACTKARIMLLSCRGVNPIDASDRINMATATLVALTDHPKLHVAAAALCALSTKLQQPIVTGERGVCDHQV